MDAGHEESLTMGRNSIPRKLTAKDQLCFMHIPKTGGLTLVAILDRFYREDEICPLHQATWRLPREKLSKYRLIIAHGSYQEFVSDRIPRPLFVTWLRHPVERTLSVYQHIRINTYEGSRTTSNSSSFKS